MGQRLACLWLVALCVLCALCALSPASAQNRDEARRILEQDQQRQSLLRERELQDALDASGERPTIVIDGQTHTVGKNANDLGQALYLSLQHRQWQAAALFLAEYLTLPDHDRLLVYYAQGSLARALGHYREAVQAYTALLELQPDFLPARLELARVLFEDQQDARAQALFAAIATSIDADDPKTAGVRATIAQYQQALAQRLQWSGTFAFGPAWTDNANRTSASQTCLWLHEESGTCIIDRKLPDAIRAEGIDFDGSLQRRMVLYGHHGLSLRALAFGQAYRDHSEYNELNASLQAGYSYRSGRHNAVLAPSFDYYAVGNAALSGAWGLHAEWSRTLSPASMLKLEADWKDQRYRQAAYGSSFDGIQRSASATYFRSLGPRWMLFAGVDAVDSQAPEQVNAYLSRGLRAGASLQWPSGISQTLFASYRERDHGAYSELFGERRSDQERGYTFVLRAERFAFAGFTPVLTLRHSRVRSNVDWLYSYDRDAASLKLERSF